MKNKVALHERNVTLFGDHGVGSSDHTGVPCIMGSVPAIHGCGYGVTGAVYTKGDWAEAVIKYP